MSLQGTIVPSRLHSELCSWRVKYLVSKSYLKVSMALKMVLKVGSILSCQKIRKVISSVIRIWNKLKMLNFWRAALRPWLSPESPASLDLLQYDLKVQIMRIQNPDQVSSHNSQLRVTWVKWFWFDSTAVLNATFGNVFGTCSFNMKRHMHYFICTKWYYTDYSIYWLRCQSSDKNDWNTYWVVNHVLWSTWILRF